MQTHTAPPLQLLLLMEQRPPAGARKRDPETSKAAARAVRTSGLRWLILSALECNPSGLTIAELSTKIERKEVSVSPRMKGLLEAGEIRASGVRKNRGSKVDAIVWVKA